ncbi:MAG: hypothetical protein F9K29_16905 [Hyphomicrobiaceae bacterium]|nr:MAG: hypothetical protein F9K29_16905 [Hyphomicrobiaceae bacterium]
MGIGARSGYGQAFFPRRSSAAAGVAILAAAAAASAIGQSPGASQTFTSAEFGYTVTLPAGCRHDEGPGTIDVVCATDLDPGRSAEASATSALVLEAAVERVAADEGKSAAALAEGYGEADFRRELPEAICGVADAARVKIDRLEQVFEGPRVVYTATVACPEIRFLGVGERRARVRYVIAPGLRYRLFARAPKEDFEQRTDVVGAFFSSFRVTSPEGKSQ